MNKEQFKKLMIQICKESGKGKDGLLRVKELLKPFIGDNVDKVCKINIAEYQSINILHNYYENHSQILLHSLPIDRDELEEVI